MHVDGGKCIGGVKKLVTTRPRGGRKKRHTKKAKTMRISKLSLILI